MGGFSTIWGGTAFDCLGQGNEILLRHSQFSESGLPMVQCNGGIIIGHGRNRTFDGLDDSKFISELTIHLPLLNTTSNTLKGETVECTREGDVIDTHTIVYTRNSSGTYRSMTLCFITNNGTHNVIIVQNFNIIAQLHLLTMFTWPKSPRMQ